MQLYYGSEELCGDVPNRLDVTEGWDFLMRIYRPGPDVLDGSYKLPVTEPIGAAETREITREAYTYGFPLVETYKTLHKQAIDNARPSFGLIVHHTDAEREYGYDAKPMSSGRLVTALAAASKNGSTLVDMKADWKIVFPETK